MFISLSRSINQLTDKISNVNFFLKFQIVYPGNQVQNQLVRRQYLLVTDEQTSVKILTGGSQEAQQLTDYLNPAKLTYVCRIHTKMKR